MGKLEIDFNQYHGLYDISLWNGDCLEIFPFINDNSIDMVITDPPYGINYKSNLQNGNRRSGEHKIVRDKNYFEEISNDAELPVQWIYDVFKKIKKGGAMYIFCHWSKWSSLEYHVKAAGFKTKNMIVVNKSNHGMGDLKGCYAPKHELILFCTKGRHILNMNDGRKKDVFDLPVKYSGAKHFHPNEKPASWITPFILESSNANNIVLDPFVGCGTTGIVSFNNNRKFIGIEIDKNYYDTAIERINPLIIEKRDAEYGYAVKT